MITPGVQKKLCVIMLFDPFMFDHLIKGFIATGSAPRKKQLSEQSCTTPIPKSDFSKATLQFY